MRFLILTFFSFIFFFTKVTSQTLPLQKRQKYLIDSIEVIGLKSFNPQTVISYSGLRKGQTIQFPGDQVSSVINKLWNLDLFSDINFYAKNITEKSITLQIEIEELPTLNEVKINGIKKNKIQNILKETELDKGKKLSESFLTNTKNYIINKFKKEGYLNTKINIRNIEDSTQVNTLNLLINIDKGERVKIRDINFKGNEKFKGKSLVSKLKNIKEKKFYRFWKKSKYIPDEFTEDKENLIDFFKEKGYRDARILNDTVIINKDNTLTINFEFVNNVIFCISQKAFR